VGAQTLGDIKGEYILYVGGISDCNLTKGGGVGDRSILHGCSSAGRVYIHTYTLALINSN
jgi:hypothetical protein